MMTVTIIEEHPEYQRREQKSFFLPNEGMDDLAEWQADNYEHAIVKMWYWPVADQYIWRFLHFCELYAGIGEEFAGYEVI